MKITFEQAVILFAQKYREQQLNLIAELFRNDGGPGSGNHNHKGVPGQVGGSAPREHLPDFKQVKDRLLSGSSDGRTAMSPLKQLTDEEFSEVRKLDIPTTGQKDVTIDIGDLYSTQPTNSISRLETVYDHFKDDPDALYDNIVRPDEFMQSKPNAPVRVVRYKGKNVIVDGNHRICILKALGEKTVKVKFVDLDKRKDNADGGPGSGNFGHEGRPGEVGGSGPAEYAGMSDEGKSVIKAHLKDPYHFGQSDEQKAANRQKLIRALSDIGVKVEHDEENDTYSAICTDMSYEENKALDGALNQGAFSYGVDRETYIQKCNEEGKPIRLHETPTEVYDGWLWSKSGKRQTDGTPVHRDMTKEQVLSDDDLVKYSGLDGTVNPTGKAEAEKARDAAMAAMSDAEISALNDYTRQWHGANYAAVNQYLVTGEGSEQAKTAAAKITSATDHPIGVDCITCRGDQSIFGTGRDEEIGKLVRKVERGDYSSARKLRDMLVGETVTNQAAMSTSPNDPTSGYGQRPVQYIFRTPKEAKAVDITSVSAFGGGRSEAEKKLAATGLFGSVEHEAEVLYKPGTRYKIADVQFSMSVDRKGKKTGQVIIVADILNDNEDSRADADEPEKWITINGAHVPLDENGEMQGKVADRIKAEKASSETAMHPASTEYDYSDGDSEDEWIQKNVRKLMPVYKKGGSDAVDSEWRKFRMARVTKAVHEISKTDADAIVADHVSQSVYDGWFRGADSGYKPKLVDAMLSSPEMRTAGLSLAYENYRNCTDSPLSFEKFLTTPITMYRGGHGQRHTKDDVFSAYTFDRKTAEHFAGKGGKITEAKIRPIDTYGSMRAVGESEIWVPREIAPNGNTDSRADGRIKLMSVTDLRFVFEAVKGLFRKRLANGEESAIVKADTNLDADDPDSWITMPNGVHVPVKNGKAIGGPIIGKPLKDAGKTKPLTSFRISKRMSPYEYAKVQKAINRHFEGTGVERKIGKHCGRFVDPNFYIFVPHDFNEYEYKFRIPIVGDEEVINEWRTLFDDREWK